MTTLNRPILFYSSIVFLAFILVGCASAPSSKIQIPVGEPVVELARMETYEIKTCGSTAELREPYGVHYELKPNISLADQATSIASGATYTLSMAEKDQLADQIKKAYQPVFETAQEELNQKTFIAAGDKATTFSVRLYSYSYQSTLTTELQGEAWTIAYQVNYFIPEVTGATSADCGG